MKILNNEKIRLKKITLNNNLEKKDNELKIQET